MQRWLKYIDPSYTLRVHPQDLASTWPMESHLHFLVMEPTQLVLDTKRLGWEISLKYVIFLANNEVVPGSKKVDLLPFETLFPLDMGSRDSYTLENFGRNVFQPLLRERTTGPP